MGFDLGINGKTAFVTGGASGIGAVICRTLVEQGANVVVSDRDIRGAAALSEELNALGGHTLPAFVDVSDSAAAETAVREAVDKFGGLHLAVNNAGIVTPRGLVHEQSPESWALCLAVNLTGVFNCMRAQIPAMLNSGGGSIVNVASIAGLIGVPTTAAYTAAKHGVVGLTKAAALDYADKGIRVNAIAPGYVDTPLIAGRSQDERDAIAQRHPMARLAHPQELADLAVYLLSNRASFITGSIHLADGGYTAR